MTISAKLIEILVCPKCKGSLSFNPVKQSLVCNLCLLSYPVRDGIPVMLIDEAERLER